MIVIGHRGASGYRPEHTLASYRLAIEQGADFIEPDLVPTADGRLVARHENEIGGTTDVAAHPEFATRRTTKTVDGIPVSGWFTEDFTVAEIKTLRARERIPAVRPANAAYDGRFEIPTFEEVVELARASAVGLYPETKHPSYFAALGLAMEAAMVRILHAHGYRGPDAPVFLQSFEVGNLVALRDRTDLRLVQLIDAGGAPWDVGRTDGARSYAELAAPPGLDFVAGYAAAIGVHKDVLIPRDPAGRLASPSPVIADAHARGLDVHAWTFRRENRFLPADRRRGPDPNGFGDLAGEVAAFRAAGVNGCFTDNPDLVRPAG